MDDFFQDVIDAQIDVIEAVVEYEIMQDIQRDMLYDPIICNTNNVVCQPGCQKSCCVQASTSSFEPKAQANNGKQKFEQKPITHTLLYFEYEQWKGPKEVVLTRNSFNQISLSSISKMKCTINPSMQKYGKLPSINQAILKLVIGGQDIFFAAQKQVVQQYFNNLILNRQGYGSIVPFNGEVQGPIYKKSDILGNWQTRYVKITSWDGLKSYRNKNQNHTVHIRQIKQIWTWFQIIEYKYLIIKIKHKMKFQFGIPLPECHYWLPAFFSLLKF